MIGILAGARPPFCRVRLCLVASGFHLSCLVFLITLRTMLAVRFPFSRSFTAGAFGVPFDRFTGLLPRNAKSAWDFHRNLGPYTFM